MPDKLSGILSKTFSKSAKKRGGAKPISHRSVERVFAASQECVRFLTSRRDVCPQTPAGYFDEESASGSASERVGLLGDLYQALGFSPEMFTVLI